MRKIVATACAVVLALGTAGNAFAAPSPGSTYTSSVSSSDNDNDTTSSSSSSSSSSGSSSSSSGGSGTIVAGTGSTVADTTSASTTESTDSSSATTTYTEATTEATVNNSDGSQGTLESGETIVVTESSTDRYENTAVAAVVNEFNSNAQITVEQYVNRLAEVTGQTAAAQTVTNYSNAINLSDYTAVTDVLDLGIQSNAGAVAVSHSAMTSYNTGQSYTVSQTVSEFSGYTREDVIFVQTDPVTGNVYYIEPDSIDPATGRWTATFPCLGPVIYMVRSHVADTLTNTQANARGTQQARQEQQAQGGNGQNNNGQGNNGQNNNGQNNGAGNNQANADVRMPFR